MDTTFFLPTMSNEQYRRINEEMSLFKDKYFQKTDNNNSEIVISEFESKHDEWFSIVPYMQKCDLYGDCLVIYSIATDLQLSFDRLNRLSLFIYEFEDYKYSPHNYLQVLYHNIGISWHNLNKLYDNNAVKAFRKSIFYLLGLSSSTSYSPVCYSFRRCSTYLYQALIKEQINLSSPSTFNDPFDSPIIALLDNQDEISKLIREAYLSCVKIACFISNVMLPFEKDPKNSTSEIIRDKQKSKGNIPEFLNELMWAHYADYHKGICIKYHFPNSFTQVYTKPNIPVRYFRDVEYKDDLSILNAQDSISIMDAFFAKSKAWEYENELRLLQCDLNGKGDYDTIDIPNCIEAIYFGVRCSQRDIDTIMEIMKNRVFITKTSMIINNKVETIENKESIQFYKMEFDSTKFGSLNAIPI